LQAAEKKLRSVENVLKYLNILYEPVPHEIMDLQKRLSSQNTELEKQKVTGAHSQEELEKQVVTLYGRLCLFNRPEAHSKRREEARAA